MNPPTKSFCGHDCSRCITRLASVRNDPALRERARRFYESEFGIAMSPEELRCFGCRSGETLRLCRDCPWKACCRKRGVDACAACPDYPCRAFAAYEAKYVNRCNQTEETT